MKDTNLKSYATVIELLLGVIDDQRKLRDSQCSTQQMFLEAEENLIYAFNMLEAISAFEEV